MAAANERIFGKIKKCLALSQSSEPHEASAALRQAGQAKVQERRAGTMGLNSGFEAGASESIHRPVGDREPTLRLA